MDIIEEDEKQREEELQKWWKDNLISIIAGVVAALVIITCIWLYRDHTKAGQEQNASEYYSEVIGQAGQDPKAEAEVKKFISSHSDSYGALASIQLAKTYVADKKYKDAYDLLKAVPSFTNDEIIVSISSLRAARIAIQLGKFEDAAAMLNAVTSDIYKSAVAEIRGALESSRGNKDAALKAYDNAIKIAGGDAGQILSMKRDDLKQEKGYPMSPELKNAKADVKADVKADTKADVKADTKADVKADTKANVKADTKADVKADTKADVKADTKADVKADTKADVKADVKADTKADTKADVKADTKADVKSTDAKASVKADSK